MMNDWEQANINLIYSAVFSSFKAQDGIACSEDRESDEMRSLRRKRAEVIYDSSIVVFPYL